MLQRLWMSTIRLTFELQFAIISCMNTSNDVFVIPPHEIPGYVIGNRAAEATTRVANHTGNLALGERVMMCVGDLIATVSETVGATTEQAINGLVDTFLARRHSVSDRESLPPYRMREIAVGVGALALIGTQIVLESRSRHNS